MMYDDIKFYDRSTALDTWNDMQIRSMKLGGNSAAGVGLGCRVGSSSASEAKYTSRAAIDYKNKLVSRIKADKASSPTDPFNEASVVEDLSEKAPEPFKASPVLPQKPTTETVVGASKPLNLGGSSKKPTLGKKLGAVKAVAVDFNEIEAQVFAPSAAEETTTSFEVEKFVDAEPIQAAPVPVKQQPQQQQRQQQPVEKKLSKEQEAAMGRLGMGMKKLSLQQKQAEQKAAATATASAAKVPVTTNNPNNAHKSISSDQIFKKNDEEKDAIVREKLRSVQGQSSISSSDFFGSPKDRNGSIEGHGNDDDYEDYAASRQSGTQKPQNMFHVFIN